MPHLAFCANCGSDDLRIGSRTTAGVEVSCYKCTKRFALSGIMLGEVDFLAGAQAKVNQMIERARDRAKAATAGGTSTKR